MSSDGDDAQMAFMKGEVGHGAIKEDDQVYRGPSARNGLK